MSQGREEGYIIFATLVNIDPVVHEKKMLMHEGQPIEIGHMSHSGEIKCQIHIAFLESVTDKSIFFLTIIL